MSYSCPTEVNTPVVPVVSQGLPLSLSTSIDQAELDVVIADLGHCESGLKYAASHIHENHAIVAQRIGRSVISRRKYSRRHFDHRKSFSAILGARLQTYGTLAASYVS